MTVGFAKDIRPLFTDMDISHMRSFCDLSSHADVKANAKDIMGRLNGSGGPQMPPAIDGGPWPPSQIALFQTWINDGCQP
jgi:hypothetical protein